MKSRKVPVGICIPIDLLESIDNERGDIPRSVYVTKLLKQALKAKAEEANSIRPRALGDQHLSNDIGGCN